MSSRYRRGQLHCRARAGRAAAAAAATEMDELLGGGGDPRRGPPRVLALVLPCRFVDVSLFIYVSRSRRGAQPKMVSTAQTTLRRFYGVFFAPSTSDVCLSWSFRKSSERCTSNPDEQSFDLSPNLSRVPQEPRGARGARGWGGACGPNSPSLNMGSWCAFSDRRASIRRRDSTEATPRRAADGTLTHVGWLCVTPAGRRR